MHLEAYDRNRVALVQSLPGFACLASALDQSMPLFRIPVTLHRSPFQNSSLCHVAGPTTTGSTTTACAGRTTLARGPRCPFTSKRMRNSMARQVSSNSHLPSRRGARVAGRRASSGCLRGVPVRTRSGSDRHVLSCAPACRHNGKLLSFSAGLSAKTRHFEVERAACMLGATLLCIAYCEKPGTRVTASLCAQ